MNTNQVLVQLDEQAAFEVGAVEFHQLNLDELAIVGGGQDIPIFG